MDHSAFHNEQALFALIAEGDESAFKSLFHLYVPRLLPTIRSIVQSEPQAKDIIQEVFFRVWMYRDKLPAIRNPRAWLYRIASYQSYSYIRKQIVRERVHSRLDPQNAGILMDQSNADALASFHETEKLVKVAITQLTPQSRKIYRMSREQNLSLKEIAEELRLSMQTVKNTLYRALREIQTFLEQNGVNLPLILLTLMVL